MQLYWWISDMECPAFHFCFLGEGRQRGCTLKEKILAKPRLRRNPYCLPLAGSLDGRRWWGCRLRLFGNCNLRMFFLISGDVGRGAAIIGWRRQRTAVK
ncbi:hypothetical protein MRB53_033237 [Persea americana]|uniref:Uncharacterized protein n=1 Tax=Persea americana TaxID=3435 RepID=A0ACC2KV56_PERAE|nr:hypothetical protein MRB53_033237 [Persea americana]